MKKIISMLMIVASAIWFSAPSAFALTATSGPYTVSINMPVNLTLNVTFKDSTGATVSGLNYGPLVQSPTNPWMIGSKTITAYLQVTSSVGSTYTLTVAGPQPSSGTNTMPVGAFAETPSYNPADNSGASMPAGAIVGVVQGNWASVGSTPLMIYTSDSQGTSATIEDLFAIPDANRSGAHIPLSQPAGNYNSTVTFTVTA